MDLQLRNIKHINVLEQGDIWYYKWQMSITIHVIMVKL